MTIPQKVVSALKRIPNYAELEEKSGIPRGTITNIVNDKRKIRPCHAEKLYPILVELKLIK
ncbi:MAG: hypothetical protein JWQ09_5037 [Segetibacter sp.]|nr:hypothetical protein [Segetibacter sp.]